MTHRVIYDTCEDPNDSRWEQMIYQAWNGEFPFTLWDRIAGFYWWGTWDGIVIELTLRIWNRKWVGDTFGVTDPWLIGD